MTESSQPPTTQQLLARLAAQGRPTRVDGYGTVYVRVTRDGRSAWEIAR